MTVYDCFMAHSELDMIELRLNILKDVVDYHVIVEAGETHSGNPKPPVVGDALQTERFAPFADKIIYSYARELRGANSWERERYHRSLIGNVLTFNAKPEDWVIVADADEITNPDVLREVTSRTLANAVLELDFYYYDFMHRVREGWGIGMCRWSVEQDANKIRRGEFLFPPPHIENAGWHLSYFMPPDKVVEKLDAFMHHADVARDVPRDPAWIADRMRRGEDLFGRTTQIERVEPNGNLPTYVCDNMEKYRTLGWIE